jgi:hypothetical protein
MRHFVLALVLACVLSGTALAGEIPTTGATAPQPSNSVVTTATGGHSTTVLAIILTLINSVR